MLLFNLRLNCVPFLFVGIVSRRRMVECVDKPALHYGRIGVYILALSTILLIFVELGNVDPILSTVSRKLR